jgi:hypothetical protein
MSAVVIRTLRGDRFKDSMRSVYDAWKLTAGASGLARRKTVATGRK